jgi:hypothetical protein
MKTRGTISSLTLLTGAILLGVLAPPALAGEASGETYAEALARAQSAAKPLVLDFFTEW